MARRWRAEPMQAIGAQKNGAPLARGADAGYWREGE
jgi:hypothetical protein